ncbi:MAG TPA: hypothetical protein VGR08_07295 [Thermomicrobiales bacterium]|nr:hypothetical protein [Thermomicrobiales bacterium]
MIRQAVISGGVAYHHGLIQPGGILAGFEIIEVGDLASVDLNQYDLVLVLRSTDGDALRARRYQFARFLDRGGVLIAFGESWSGWLPASRWEPECAEDVLEPVVTSDHPLVAGSSPADLHWHPPLESWCCHGHFIAPEGAEVLVRNQRGDAWLYIDRSSTNGVIVASSNLDPDTHTYHGSPRARTFFDRLLAWARTEAELTAERRSQIAPKIAGLFSSVHFQKGFYEDAEFGPQYAVLPVWELAAANLHDFAALWIPRESNQDVLMANQDKLRQYLDAGGTIVSFDQVNQPWLPAGAWELRPASMETIRILDHPMVSHLTIADVKWHSHGLYDAYPGAEVLIDDAEGGVILFLDSTTFAGTLIAGTLDPDCHVGFGTQRTRPLLRAIVAWVKQPQRVAFSAS